MVTRSYAEKKTPALGLLLRLGVLLGRLRVPAGSSIVRAVVASRLLVLAAGAYSSLFVRPVSGWQILDPTHLSTSFGAVGNVLTASGLRWDSIHYLSIAAHGYKPAGDTAFFPFYPLLIHVLGWVVFSQVAAGFLISFVSFGCGLFLLHRIAREELGERVADATILLLTFAPLSLFFTAIYTESLFFVLSVGTFYLARSGRFRWACLTAACATVTHVEGITLWAPVAYMFWEANGRRFDVRRLRSWDAAALLLPPAALLALCFYMHEIGFSWLAPLLGAHPTGHGHSIAPIIPTDAPASEQLVRTIVGPPVTIWHAFDTGATGLAQTLKGVKPLLPGSGNMFTIGFQNLIYLVILLICLTTLAAAWRRLPKAYAIYATLVLIVFTMSVVNLIPLRAFDRYMLPLFPLWMMAAKWLDERRMLWPVLTLSACLLVLYTTEFTRWVMVA